MPASAPNSGLDTQDRLERTLLARDFVDELHHEALGPVSRALNRVRDSLPLSAIPVVVAWTLLVMLLPQREPGSTLHAYFAGLFLVLSACLCLVFVVALLNRRRVADAVLARIADHIDGLAYHPNGVLKQALALQGYITQAHLLAWTKQQRAILDVRARDLRARRRSATVPVDAGTVQGEGARRFLRS